MLSSLLYAIVGLVCAPAIPGGVRQFSVESASMEPTLPTKSIFAVHRCGYGLSRYTFDGFELPIVGRLPSLQPARGDMIVFRPLQFPEAVYVKRVIGVAGDRVELREGRVYLNGARLERRPVDDLFQGDRKRSASREVLPGVAPYSVYQDNSNVALDTVATTQVQPGMLYVMGDNRDNSLDSRTAGFGQVPIERVIGPVVATGGWSWSALFAQQ